MSKYQKYTVTINEDQKRIDQIVQKLLKLPMSALQKAFRKGDIKINGSKIAYDAKVKEGDIIEVYKGLLPDDDFSELEETESEAYYINSMKIFSNRSIQVFNKKRGVLSQGEDSLDELVKRSFRGESLTFKPGPLHRLDRNTTGLLVFSSSLEGARTFSTMLQEHTIEKVYLGLVRGSMDQNTYWKDNLVRDEETNKSFVDEKGKESLTQIYPLLSNEKASLVCFVIKTGRTHQIRAQAAEHGFPLLGDGKYNPIPAGLPYVLHAYKMIFTNDDLGVKELKAPLYNDSLDILSQYFSDEELKVVLSI